MPITVSWFDDTHQIAYLHSTGTITTAEISTALDDVLTLVESVDHAVDLLIHIEGATLPRGFVANFSNVANHPLSSHPRFRQQVIVTQSRVFLTTGRLFRRVFRMPMRFVETMEEALDLLHQRSD